MELEVILALAMFACAIIALLGGYSVALTLGGVALLFALIGIGIGAFDEAFLPRDSPEGCAALLPELDSPSVIHGFAFRSGV